jgi:uncharacterized protein (DUF1697 family)
MMAIPVPTTVIISLLRGVNVAGHDKIKMDALRALYVSLKLHNPQTYVQSGNVIFATEDSNLDSLANYIETAIEKKFGFRPAVILRSSEELRKIMAQNPFAKRRGIEPSKLLIVFLAATPAKNAMQLLQERNPGPEEVHIHGRELYIYFPNGIGRSKLTTALLDRATGTAGTGRNWNTVTKLLEMAELLESSA